MADLYRVTVIDVEGVEVRADIQKAGTVGPAAEDVAGRISWGYGPTDSLRQPIRDLEATVTLQASTTQDFQDLYTEQPRQWSLTIYREGQIVFTGWVNNDQISADWVNDVWELEVTADDGLKDISNREYRTVDGNPIDGKGSLREILQEALALTFLERNLYIVRSSATNPNYPLEYVQSTGPLVTDSYFNQQLDRLNFRRSNAEEYDSARRVLETILRPANAFITQFNGDWYVTWSCQIPRNNGDLTYQGWDSDGNPIADKTLDASATTIGSHLLGFYPHWIEENQRLELRPSLGASQITYDFGALASILANSEFNNDGTTIVGWTINQPNTTGTRGVILNPAGRVEFGLAEPGFSEQDPALTSNITTVSVEEGAELAIKFEFGSDQEAANASVLAQRIRIRLIGTVDNYTLDEGNFWTTQDRRIELQASRMPGARVFELRTPPVPEEGTVQVLIYPVDNKSGNPLFVTTSYFSYFNIGISYDQDAVEETYKAQRIAAPSPYTYEPGKIRLGDWRGTLYLSSLFQADGVTETNLGYVTPTNLLGAVLEARLYTTTVVDSLNLEQKVARYFQGSVFGYVPHLTRVFINGFPGAIFMVLEATYLAEQNITQLVAQEVFYQPYVIPPDPNPFLDDVDTIEPWSSDGSQETTKAVIKG